MEYQEVINLLDNTPNQPSKFRTKSWVEINDDARGTYNSSSEIEFETSMRKSSLCDYSDAHTLVIGTITVTELDAGRWNNRIHVVFKNYAPFTDCMREIKNTQIDNAKDIDFVMPMYSLIEYSNDHAKNQNFTGNTIEKNQLWMIILLLFFLVIVLHLNFNKK